MFTTPDPYSDLDLPYIEIFCCSQFRPGVKCMDNNGVRMCGALMWTALLPNFRLQ